MNYIKRNKTTIITFLMALAINFSLVYFEKYFIGHLIILMFMGMGSWLVSDFIMISYTDFNSFRKIKTLLSYSFKVQNSDATCEMHLGTELPPEVIENIKEIIDRNYRVTKDENK